MRHPTHRFTLTIVDDAPVPTSGVSNEGRVDCQIKNCLGSVGERVCPPFSVYIEQTFQIEKLNILYLILRICNGNGKSFLFETMGR